MEGYKRIPKPIFVGSFAFVAMLIFRRLIGHIGGRPANRVVVGLVFVAAAVAGSCFGLALCNHRERGDLRPRDLLLPSEVCFIVYAAGFNLLAQNWFYKVFYIGRSGLEPATHDFEWRTLAAVTILVPLAVSWLPAAVLPIEWTFQIERAAWAVIALVCLALTLFLAVWLIGFAFAVPTALAFWNTKSRHSQRLARYVAMRGLSFEPSPPT